MAIFNLSGRTGLRVSPLSLGAGTFGEKWGEGFSASKETVDEIIGAYLDLGGNVLDTADGYQEGQSEEWIGDWFRRTGRRGEVVVATKYGFATQGGPFGGGNSRTTILRQVEASLKRLNTDYIDLYYQHVWDTMTPPDEVIATLHTLVESGKVRYVGLSNVPGWYLGRAQTLAELRGWAPLAALQVNYSLLARTTELEYTDAAQSLGLGIHAWSPLANGLLSGKYRVVDGKLEGKGRVTDSWVTDRTVDIANPIVCRTIDAVIAAAQELGKTPAQVALRWVMERPGVASVIIGARNADQLRDNMGALDFALTPEIHARLEEASRPAPIYPWSYFGEATQSGGVRSGNTIRAESPTYRGPGARW